MVNARWIVWYPGGSEAFLTQEAAEQAAERYGDQARVECIGSSGYHGRHRRRMRHKDMVRSIKRRGA